MVVNGQQAKIQVGQQLGFTVATVTQTSTIQDVQFLDTGVVLSVKPTISRDNKVLMEVKPEVSNGQINPETLLPEEETRELETSVLLNNHQGMVIGGLIQENDRTVIKKLPWLGDIRHVGKFFQNRKSTRSRTEIIVALVPHIVNVDECLNHDQCDLERQVMEYERVDTPLLHGPLQQTCRPWEPKLPDTVGAERHYDVNKINRMIP
jgi:type II secretory pathway component GspD/PulD (secretin)